jgi:hypothetical protein
MGVEEIIIANCPPDDGRKFECQCARCGSAVEFEFCTHCEDGFDGHDCGEDCCACLHPEENVVCQICEGEGGWRTCMSSADYCNANPLPGRADVPRGSIEWFAWDEE